MCGRKQQFKPEIVECVYSVFVCFYTQCNVFPHSCKQKDIASAQAIMLHKHTSNIRVWFWAH